MVVMPIAVVAGCNPGTGERCFVRTVAEAEAALEEGCHVKLVDYQGSEASIVNRNPTSTLLVDHDLTPQLQRLNFEGPGLEARRVPEVILVSPSCSEVGGSAAEVLLDITLVTDAAGDDAQVCPFSIGPGGHVKLRAGTGVQVSRVIARGTLVSDWSEVSLDVDETFHPTEFLDISPVRAGLTLQHLQAFGTEMREVYLNATPSPEILDAYVDWLADQDFGGIVVVKRPNDDDTVIYDGAQ